MQQQEANHSQQEPNIVTENDVIDFIFFTLYLNLDKNELHFENEILAESKLSLDAKQIEHLRELILSTGFIKASIGFGKSGYIYLTQNGIQLIKQFNTYSNYVATVAPQQIASNHTSSNTTTTTIETPKYMDDEMSG